MIVVLIILNILCLIVSAVWLIDSPGCESTFSLIMSIIALIRILFPINGTHFKLPPLTRRGVVFLIISFSIVLFATWNEILGPILTFRLTHIKTNSLILGKSWITYDPTDFNPYTNTFPVIDSIRKELRYIHQGGFKGIISFSGQGTLSLVPELAKKEGLYVIMGIWDPNNRYEVKKAISKKRFVDGYCIGHNGLETLYSFTEIKKAIRYVRFKTKLPVTTTEKYNMYLKTDALLNVGDWIFPDCHVSMIDTSTSGYKSDPIHDARITMEMAKSMENKSESSSKPVLLKMITYPADGIPGASLHAQGQFFFEILENRRNVDYPLSKSVSFSFHSAFDTNWKNEWPFYQWDAFTGLFERNGQPRPAVAIIIRRL